VSATEVRGPADAAFEALDAAGIARFAAGELRDWPKGAGDPVFVTFLAPWCELSRAQAGAVQELAKAVGGRAAVRYVDTDDAAIAAERLNVRRVPVTVLFARDREIARRGELATASELAAFADRAIAEIPPEDATKKDAPAGGVDAGARAGGGGPPGAPAAP
jgi:thioredoxin-like negative regulator of GroEL